MSYSYKPVLIMAIVEHGGVLRIDEAVDYFIKYYGQRLSEGLIAERADSIFSTLRCMREKIAFKYQGKSRKRASAQLIL